MISAEPMRLTTPTRGGKLGTSSAIPMTSRPRLPESHSSSWNGTRVTLSVLPIPHLQSTTQRAWRKRKRWVSLVSALAFTGCYAAGNSVLIPPPFGQYGTVGKNIFRNPNYRAWDFSVTKEIKIKERFTAQFRAELFNVLNHPLFGQVDAGHLVNNDPSAGVLGLANETPDQAAGNPVLGSGANRDVQLGLKLIF